ncbi:MAG: hypothetical protein JOZ05_16680 [Acetobacteraceae bacterium]|nr:hypothetical protein [Acetobacteraceae bacterium]
MLAWSLTKPGIAMIANSVMAKTIAPAAIVKMLRMSLSLGIFSSEDPSGAGAWRLAAQGREPA